MKVLVTYYSDSGNTEKVAKAIYEEISKMHRTDLKKVKDTRMDDLEQYDLVFLGSPTHTFDLSVPVKRMLAALPEAPRYKLAGFITHMSPTSENHQGHDKCFTSFEKVSKDKRIDFRGVYDCQGVPTPQVGAFVKKISNVPDAEWERRMREMEKHPSADDLLRAREFARHVVAKI